MQKRGCLGCSFPLLIGLGIVVFALTIFGLISGALFGNQVSWFQIHPPDIVLKPETILNVGFFGPYGITNTMLTAWISILLIILLCFFAFRRMQLVPRGLQGVIEFAFGFILDFCVGVAGEKNGRRFFPVVATIFIFVVVNAWLSLLPIYGIAFIIKGTTIPILRGANTDLNVTLSLAIFSFVAVEYYGIKDLGAANYLKKFVRIGQLKKGLGQVFSGKVKSGLGSIFFGFIDVVVGALETLSEFIRLISFSFRLFGNMLAGEILLIILAFLVPLTLAVPFYGFEMLIGLIQAFVFGSLTLIFINLAVASQEDSHD